MGPRTAYSGTPEPTSFGERDSGKVLLVDLSRDQAPSVRPLDVATLSWLVWEERLDAGRPPALSIAECRARCEGLPRRDRTLLRLVLRGDQAPGLAPLLRDLDGWLAANLLFSEVDTSGLRLPTDGGRLGLLRDGHPLLDRLSAALGDSQQLVGLGLDEADLAPDVVREAGLLLEELCEEIWT